MRVLAVVSEIYPLIKTGGLADVAGALPAALARHGVEVVTAIPGYPAVLAGLSSAEIMGLPAFFGGDARLLAGRAAGLDLLVLDAPHLFDRPGGPYGGPDGQDWPDNAVRFAALCRAAAGVCLGDAPDFVPDIVHCHDWQAGLTLAYLAYDGRPRPSAVATIHNIAFQGRFAAGLLAELGLPSRAFAMDGVEYYGGIGFLKAGLHFADRITTVSPTYAREIQTEPWGCGLEGLLQARTGVLSGIVNGIDTEVWNPRTDPHIASRYGADTLGARAPNRSAVRDRFGLGDEPAAPLFGVVSRLTDQKGIDLIADAAPHVLDIGGQLVVLGTGDRRLEERLAALASAHPGRVGVRIGYDEDLAHLVQAGTDALLVPSRFEPCGLTQLCALRYGAIPIVAPVGGLADTVIDLDQAPHDGTGAPTGIKLEAVSVAGLIGALNRAAALWRDREAWTRIQRNGMATDVSWLAPAARYAELYRALLASKK